MWAGALAEGFGIAALVPLLAVAADSAEAPQPLRGLIEGGFVPQHLLFWGALGVFLAAMLARALMLYLRDQASNRLTEGYEASLKLRTASALAAAGWQRAASIGQGGLHSALLTDIPRCAAAVHYWQNAIVSGTVLAVQFGLAAILSPTMALITLVLIVAALASSWRWLGKGARGGAAISQSSERSSAAAVRLEAGLKAALAQGTVAAFLREYGATLQELTSVSVAVVRENIRLRALASIAAALYAALLLVIGHLYLELAFPLLLALLILFARMSGPAQLLQQSLQQLAGYSPAFASIVNRVGEPVEAPKEDPGVEPIDWAILTIDQVSFQHSGGAAGLHGVSFVLGAGQWVGLSGASGAGKTTLIDIVAGLFVPDVGQILVDGRPLDGEWVARWRRSLAYVGQAAIVFDDSVRGNLLADGVAADDERLWQVLEAVGLKARIAMLPQGLDSPVGTRGSMVSGGERQRLTIARAILREPSLYILDEATNALDAASEIELLRRLRALHPRSAALLIAHRQAPLELCDAVLELNHGTSVL
jgi:ATP-binding cassette subfamily C protein